jgi:hypothetical protein
MNLEFFITRLKEMKPSQKVFQEGYLLKKRRVTTNQAFEKGDIIAELINKFETMHLQFGDYSFADALKEYQGAKVFCNSSGTFLAYFSPYEEVIEYSRDEEIILNHCAKDSASFLEAILHIQEMYALRLDDSIEVDDNTVNNQFLNKCVNSAGGSKFAPFYESIIF